MEKESRISLEDKWAFWWYCFQRTLTFQSLREKKGEQGGKGETKRQIKGVTMKKEGIKVYQVLLKTLRPIDS